MKAFGSEFAWENAFRFWKKCDVNGFLSFLNIHPPLNSCSNTNIFIYLFTRICFLTSHIVHLFVPKLPSLNFPSFYMN